MRTLGQGHFSCSRGIVQYIKSVDSPAEPEGWLRKQAIRNEGLVLLSLWLSL